MSLSRVLITGGSGLLALNWACSMRHRFDVILGTHQHRVRLRGTRSETLHLDAPDRFEQQLRAFSPSVIIHTAGMTSVEQCEERPQQAEQANAGLAHTAAAVAYKLGIRLVHISTDHLFSGTQSLVSEFETPTPLNVYARTKWHAEQLVQAANPDALIVRTNFFGWGSAKRQSFSDWIIGSLRGGRPITMFDDVYFTPILADTLALAVHEAVAKGASGVYNIVGEERLSKLEFAERAADYFGLPRALIQRGQIDGSALKVARPHDMSLDNKKIRGLLNRNIGSVADFLRELHDQEQQGRAVELSNAVMEN